MKFRNLLAMLLLIAVLIASCAPAATEAPAAAPVEEPTQAPAPTEEPAPTEVPVEAVDCAFAYYADGVEADIMQPLIDKFMAENPRYYGCAGCGALQDH